MAIDNSQSHDVDLDSTDQLPILEGAVFDEDVADDAVRMEYAPPVPSMRSEFPRSSGVDLPSLAESVRSVEERIARQNAEYEALSRSYEKARDAETAAASRSQMLVADLASLRALLETEQARTRDLDKALADKSTAVDTARSRMEEALREAERHHSEARTLRDTLAAREASMAQVTHSLGERDAQLSALQREHAKVVPALEERSKLGARLELELQAEKERSAGLAVALVERQQKLATLTERLKVGDHEIKSAQRELLAIKAQSASYLEALRTREWRRGFDQNLFRELDAQIGAVQSDHGALQAERDQLRQRVTELESQLAGREQIVAKVQAAAAEDERQRARHTEELRQGETARSALEVQLGALEVERSRLKAEVAGRDDRVAELERAASAGEAQRAEFTALLKSAESTREELLAKIDGLEAARSRLSDERAARDETIARLNTAAASHEASRAKHELILQQLERAVADLAAQIAALEKERTRLNGELAAKDEHIAEARAAVDAEVQRGNDRQTAAAARQEQLADQIRQLKLDIQKREDESTVLLTHLKEARQPLEPILAEVKRLTDELAAKAVSLEQLNQENRAQRAALERARGALEEREFLIRRLERSEMNNANVLGRIQTSIERLGSPTSIAGNPASPPMECTAELVRVDGQHKTSYPVGRRTRIGRAAGCEMHIDSSSVSRHHALLLLGSRDLIVEDLNSTNGVIVNGRKVSRQLLNDGDLLTIGEAQLRVHMKLVPRALELGPSTASGASSAPGTSSAPGAPGASSASGASNPSSSSAAATTPGTSAASNATGAPAAPLKPDP